MTMKPYPSEDVGGDEVWRPVAGYEGIYDVSDCGRVRNSTGQIMQQRPIRRGEFGVTGLLVMLSRGGKRKRHPVHRLVVEAFLRPLSNGEEVHHQDRNPLNNRLENLEPLSRRLHLAKHSFKCWIRSRDAFKCAECGLTDEEHHQLLNRPLNVHCLRSGTDDELEWERLGVKQEECVTLCDWCHLGKHSIVPSILHRDGLACVDCQARTEEKHQWRKDLRIHRRTGLCDPGLDPGLTEDPNNFVTLCHRCHEAKHPDRLPEYLALGGVIVLPFHTERKNLTNHQRLELVRKYYAAVLWFMDHLKGKVVYFKNTAPSMSRTMGQVSIDSCSIPIPVDLKRHAARQAIHDLLGSYVWSAKDETTCAKLSETERQAYLGAKREASTERRRKFNSKPYMQIRVGERFFRVPLPD